MTGLSACFLLLLALIGESTASLYACAPHDANCFTVTVTDDPDLDYTSCPAEKTRACSYRKALQNIVDRRPDKTTHKFAPVTIVMPVGTVKVNRRMVILKNRDLDPKYGDKMVAIIGQQQKVDANGTITQNGTVLDGAGNFTLLTSELGVDVNVSDITFINGAAPGNPYPENDNVNGGAVVNGAKMQVLRCNFFNNFAKGQGGAFSNTGDLTLDTVRFENNKAQDAGALASTGASNKFISLHGTNVHFAHNEVMQSAGAFLNTFCSSTFEQSTFEHHMSVGGYGVGGTLSNGVNGTLFLTDVSISHSTANSGGLVANSALSSVLHATRVTFSHGNTTKSFGGAVENKGTATFHHCAFWENMANHPRGQGGNPQGATLANDLTNSTAVFVNCTIDAARGGREGSPDQMVSEFYVDRPGSVLNLTFVNITNCHKAIVQMEAPGTATHPNRKVIIRGGSLCADGTLVQPFITDTRKDISAEWIAGCDEPDTWQCGSRALCSASKTAGIECSCPRASAAASLPYEMWGFPYGGDESAIPGSAGFSGCFEQWNDQLGSLTAVGCQVTPTFNSSDLAPPSSYACCALQSTDGGEVKTTITAGPRLIDHATIETSILHADVSPRGPLSTLTAKTRAFNHSFTSEFEVNVTWIAGDTHCEPGKEVICHDATGAVKTCQSHTHFPKDELDEYTTCKASPVTPACGYTGPDATCRCPVCKPAAKYACLCENGTKPDGTQFCDARGEGLGACDCTDIYQYPSPPPPPPPPASPTSGGAPMGAIIGAAAGGAVLLLGVGGYCYMRRRRRARESQALNAALLNEAGRPSESIAEPAPPMAGGPMAGGPAPVVYVAAAPQRSGS